MHCFPVRCSACLAALLCAFAGTAVHAAPGDLDPAFGNGGVTLDPMSGNDARAHALAIDGAGRIVVAGETVNGGAADFAVLRLDAGGHPDLAFGTGGRVYAGFGLNSLDEGYGVAVLGDGRIVVGGTTFVPGDSNYPDFAALRLNADGSIDAGFGNHGTGWTTSGRADGDSGIAMASDGGGFALAGHVDDGGGSDDAAVLRLDTLGMPLPLFGDAGVALAGADTLSASAVAATGDGGALIGGQLEGGGTFVLRLDANGDPDPAFAGDGRAELGALLDRIDDLLLLGDGRVLAAGVVQLGDAHAAIVQLAPDGSVDAAFGSGGRFALPAASVGMSALGLDAIARQPDGRLVAAGRASGGGNTRSLVLRVTAQGALDPTFGSGGVRIIDSVAGTHWLEALALQADGAIVAAGRHRATPAAEDQFFVARLLGGDGGALPIVSIADASRVEGDAGTSLMSFTLSLSSPSDGSIAVDVASDDGSATANVDYVPTTATVLFANGASSATFEVPVIGDTDAEADETLFVRLSSPVGAVLGDAEAVGTIIDDDAAPPLADVQPAPAAGPFALLLLGVLIVLVASMPRYRRR